MSIPREKALEKTLELARASGEGGAVLRNSTLVDIYQDFEMLEIQNADIALVEAAVEVSKAFLLSGLLYERARIMEIYEDLQGVGKLPQDESLAQAIEISKAFASGSQSYADARVSEAYRRIRSLMQTKDLELKEAGGEEETVIDAPGEGST